MRKTILFSILPLLLVFVIGAACRVNLGGPEVTEEPLPTLPAVIPTVVIPETSDPTTGSVVVTFTEDQLTQIIRDRLAASEESLIKDPRVILQNGQIEIQGQAEQGFLSGTFQAIAVINVDPEGNPDLEITKAQVGPLPIPEGVLDSVSTMIEENFTSNLGSYATGFKIDQITIDNGLMTVTGKPR